MIKNTILERAELASIVEKMVENRLKWFGYVRTRRFSGKESKSDGGKLRALEAADEDLEKLKKLLRKV